jgi:uncharacterized heparinase superfamily protein
VDNISHPSSPSKQRASVLSARAGRRLIAAREKFSVAILAVERARRRSVARVRRSRLLRWRHRAPVADDLALSPPDLRPPDPSFVDELDSGSMGLAGLTVALRGASPFSVAPPAESWARELHGFGWLRHFASARTLENDLLVRRLVGEWTARARRWPSLSWAPEVVGRRMLSWLSHASLIIDDATRRPYGAFMLSLEDQATFLSASWRNAPAGHPRLVALFGLVQSALCIAGHEPRIRQAERYLIEELHQQILPDGGHASRNPAVSMELLLDLLPLRQCFIARGIGPDGTLPAVIERMIAMLRHLRLGDGQLARFNGMGATERDTLATLLAYEKRDHPEPDLGALTLPSGYARLQANATVAVIDVGAPPPIELAGRACAGCLAFELSVDDELLFVNSGAPGSAHIANLAASRGTAHHNTLVLNGQSSARLMTSEKGINSNRQAPVQPLLRATCKQHVTNDGAFFLEASHDGYASRFGLIHTRTLTLDASGDRLRGSDGLDGAKSEMRFAWDLPFAVHFHLHPRSGARLAADGSAELVLPSGARWRLSAAGATLTVEESTHFAETTGPVLAQQVVLRAVCYGAAKVHWVLARIEQDPGSTNASKSLTRQLAEAKSALAGELVHPPGAPTDANVPTERE